MTAANYREALQLLDSAIALLRRSSRPTRCSRRELREVSRQFDLLRARLGQPQPERQRN